VTGARRVAAVDCGTNSIRLLIADLDGDRQTDLLRRMEIVRLGEGVDRTGRLSEAAIERTRGRLAEYAAAIDELGATAVRMVATSASRDAANAGDFRAMVRATLGQDPEVVTGDEEARLSFIGAVRGVGAEYPPPYLVVDIGGGSTEFVTGSAAVDAARSVDIGCVRMTERHLRSDPPTQAEIGAATADITAAVDDALSHVPVKPGSTLIGLAGSVTTVALIALGLPSYDPKRIHRSRISYDQVAAVTADLLAATREQRSRIGGMHPGRIDVIGAGALILRTIMERSEISSVVASEHDILDGIAWSQVS
jgi:exopolyphosphatase / guanosine-5'-triphosphate,3'-diphosphate pyrophosphatase